MDLQRVRLLTISNRWTLILYTAPFHYATYKIGHLTRQDQTHHREPIPPNLKMNKSNKPPNGEKTPGKPNGEAALIAEYTSLRSSIDMRVKERNHLMAIFLGLFGAVLALKGRGQMNLNTALAFPVVGLLMALEREHLDKRIRLMAKYIRDNIEPNLPKIHWYEFLTADSENQNSLSSRLSKAGHFIVPSIIVLLMSRTSIWTGIISCDKMVIGCLILDAIILLWTAGIVYKKNSFYKN